ncbi:MAG: LytTR family DNA-binding domain-containing protein [Lachnospiraceae bacterium]|nr:LytTR family DNA-binding domain-containing protein [Lachnospiraceae bacterium]
MNIAIVDDLREESDRLEGILKDYTARNDPGAKISVFRSGEEFLDGFTAFAYTVIFLDIYMEGITGIETAERIRKLDGDVCIIFLTTSSEHLWGAFHVHAYEYLVKPAAAEKVFRVMDDLYRMHTDPKAATLDFTAGKTDHHIVCDDIVSVCTAETNYLNIVDREGNVFHPRLTFSNVSKELENDTRFLLINRGILVNMDHIICFEHGMCLLRGDLKYPVFSKKLAETEQKWQNYTFAKIRSGQKRTQTKEVI